MSRSPAARRYAKALFELASEQDKLDVVEADLAEIARLLERRVEYEGLLTPYILSEENRLNLWQKILTGQAEPLVLRFILLLVKKNRVQILGEVIAAFNVFYNEARGILAVRIISARPLDPDHVQTITQRLETKFNKKIKAAQEIEPTLLGGFQVRVGDVVYDYSVNHQLELLHRRLVSA